MYSTRNLLDNIFKLS